MTQVLVLIAGIILIYIVYRWIWFCLMDEHQDDQKIFEWEWLKARFRRGK